MTADPREIQSVARAGSLIQAFTKADEWSTSALAREVKLHKSVVHRLLVTLMRSGILVQDPATDLFRLGPLMASLGRRAERSSNLLRMARPILEDLRDKSGETVSLCVLQGDRGLCLDVVESAQSMRFTVQPGDSFPAHAGCIGKVVLAFQPPDMVARVLRKRPLERYTEKTITDPRTLRAELSSIRERELGFSDGEITPGARSVGAPVFDAAGKAIASIVVSAPTVRMTDEGLPRFLAIVAAAAKQLSGELGFVPARSAA